MTPPRMLQDTLAAALQTLPLKRLRLRIDARVVNPRRTIHMRDPTLYLAPERQPPLCIAEASASRIDVPAFLRALCAAIPTLSDAYFLLRRRSDAELRTGFTSREDESRPEDSATKDEGENWARVRPTCAADRAHVPEEDGEHEFEKWREMFELEYY